MKLYIIASVVVVLLAAGLYLEFTKPADTLMSIVSKRNGGSEKPDLKPQGAAPEFTGIDHWLNLQAGKQVQSLAELRGKVVLIDFWTYSCINCIRTLPYVTKWYDEYKDKGLVVIGVHTPEFEFEKVTENVASAIKQYGINYPVAQDNHYSTWQAYHNQYWPAEYLINKEGQIVYVHFGEGNYGITENAIRTLLGMDSSAQVQPSKRGLVKTPETYVGLLRQELFASPEAPSKEEKNYTLPTDLPINHFALSGRWRFTPEYAEALEADTVLATDFTAGKMYMVAEGPASQTIRVQISVDGNFVGEIKIEASKLYTLFDTQSYTHHRIELKMLDAGLRIFAFTFG